MHSLGGFLEASNFPNLYFWGKPVFLATKRTLCKLFTSSSRSDAMKKSLIVSLLIFGLVQGRPNRGFKRFEDPFLRFEESDKVDRGRGEIERMNITSSIQMRYAITKVETRVKNAQNETQEIFFDVYIPNEAFVSNFSMTIKNTTYVAKVDTKESAQAIYDNSSSAASGLVQSRAEFKDIKHVSQ